MYVMSHFFRANGNIELLLGPFCSLYQFVLISNFLVVVVFRHMYYVLTPNVDNGNESFLYDFTSMYRYDIY